MSLEALLTALQRESEAEAARRLEQARAEGARIRGEAEAEFARRRAEVLGSLEAEWRARTDRVFSEARRVARRQVLEARQRALDELFEAARARLLDVARDPRHSATAAGHLEEAQAYVGDESVTVLCPPEWEAAVRELVGSRRGLRVKTDRSLTGIRVAPRDGSMIVDNTLAGRLERLRPTLSVEILDRLGWRP